MATAPDQPPTSAPEASTWSLSGSAAQYDARWDQIAASGQDRHGEADLIASFSPGSVLDGGCGTGRVTIELARRGVDVVGVDVDASMLSSAQAKAPSLPWVHGDLAVVQLNRRFDVVALPGNVMIFVAPGREAAVVANLARHLLEGGLLIAGFQIRRGGLDLSTYDLHCAQAGLSLFHRWATWQRDDYQGGDYAVSVHRLAAAQPKSLPGDLPVQ